MVKQRHFKLEIVAKLRHYYYRNGFDVIIAIMNAMVGYSKQWHFHTHPKKQQQQEKRNMFTAELMMICVDVAVAFRCSI